MKRGRKSGLAEAEVNLTPLIDVCFVILIMFIVAAPLLEMEQVELAGGPPMTQQNVMAIQQASSIAIHVFKDDTVAVNKQNIPLNRLQEALILAKKQNPSAKPQLFHDKKATFGTYQAVKNAVEAAGFSEMDVVLKPE